MTVGPLDLAGVHKKTQPVDGLRFFVRLKLVPAF